MVSRRAFLQSVAALSLPTFTAGCTGMFKGTTTQQSTPTSTTDDTVLRIATADLTRPLARAATLWNGNRLPTNDEYGGTLADEVGSSGPGLAGYFGRQHGFTPTQEPMEPPFKVCVSRADPQDARDALDSGSIAIAGLGSEVHAPTASEMDTAGFVRHDLFRTGQAIVVSEEVYEAGVTAVSREELLGIYNGRLTNWKSLGGPDREIYLAGTVDISGGPAPFEQTFLKNQPGGGADQLYGQVRRKVAVVGSRDDTVTRIPVRDVGSLRAGGTDDYRILKIEVDGEPRGPSDIGYPGTYSSPLFTKTTTRRREAAFLAAVSTGVVQARILRSDDRLTVLPATRESIY